MTTPNDRPAYVSIEEAARIAGLSTKTIRRRIADGSIPAFRFGPRSIRIKLADLEAAAKPVPRWQMRP